MDKETRVPKDRTDQATIQGLDTTLVTKDGMDKDNKATKDRMDRDNKATMEGLDTSLVTKHSMDKDNKAAKDSMDKDNKATKDSMDRTEQEASLVIKLCNASFLLLLVVFIFIPLVIFLYD